MNPHNTNLYPINTNKDNDLFGGYVRNPCDQQSASQRQHFLPSYAMPMSNNMSQSLMYNSQNQPIYNIMYTHQTMYRNQNSFTSNFTQDAWQDTCVKSNSYKEKYDTKKENCCTETDAYKTTNFYNCNKNSLLDPQWYYGNYENQKYTELPSCSQITQDNMNSCCNIPDKSVKSVKYCSIQKLPETDTKLLPYPKQYDNNIYLNQYNKITKEYPSCSQISRPCNMYNSSSTCLEVDKKILLGQCEVTNLCDVQNVCDVLPNQYYQTPNIEPYINVTKPLDKTDDSNGNGGESDIVVEDSDEDTDESEEIDKDELTLCIVCNLQIENISYDVSLDSTVTSFTQTKVSEKLLQILGWIPSKSEIICNICMSLLNTLDNLQFQLESVKQTFVDKYKINEICLNKKSELEENALKKPLRKKNNLIFKCRTCKKIISLKTFFKYHISKHKRKYYSCKYCKRIFRTSLILKGHIKIHQHSKTKINSRDHLPKEKVQKQFVCHICGKIFKTNTNLREHENFCSGNLPFKCKICDKCFPSFTKMNQHIKLFHEKNYTNLCMICEKGFIKNSDYKTHMLSHSTEKNYKCSTCGKIYKTLSNLNQHKKIHSEKLPFNCKICQKGFLRKENFESHLNNHNGIKLFCCTKCDKKFSRQKYLDAHIKIHNGMSKKKKCTICGKEVKHNLEEHLRIHSSIKAFECSVCLMKFLTKGALAKHTKRKHEIKELDIM